MDNDYSDSSTVGNISPEHTYESLVDQKNEYSESNQPSSSFENIEYNYYNLFKNKNVVLYPSSSLSREIDGINLIASRSTSSLTANNSSSCRYKSGPFEKSSDENRDNDSHLSTPNNKIKKIGEHNDLLESNKLSYEDLSSPHPFCSTPTTKKSKSSYGEQSSISSLRFNPASLISLPYGYNNSTFTKIRADEIIYPSEFKKKHKISEYKNDLKISRGRINNDHTSDFNEYQYSEHINDSPMKTHLIPDLTNTMNKSLYNLMMHNDYSSNPYKRRYQSVLNERRRIIPLCETLSETFEHISLPERLTKRPRKSNIKNESDDLDVDEEKETSSTEVQSSDDYQFQKSEDRLQCYSLPSLHLEYLNYIKQISDSNSKIEHALMNELKESLGNIITTRTSLFNSLHSNQIKSNDSDTVDLEVNKLHNLRVFLNNSISKLNNELVLLNYAKGLLKSDYSTSNSNDSYNSFIDASYDVKKLKRLFKHDLYSVMYMYPDAYEDVGSNEEKPGLSTSPSITFYNGLKCLNGKCLTSRYLYENNVLTECDSSSRCYLWDSDSLSETNKTIGKIGSWTHESDIAYEFLQQNKKKQLESTMEFINDVCKVAIAEIRIPKPEWSEFTEYTCLNGYCCKSCCTCVKSTDRSMIYSTSYTHRPLDDKNINFSVETKIATIDLLKNVLGSCSCYCKCNTDPSHVMDRALNEQNCSDDLINESISWYDIETSNLNYDQTNKKYLNDNVVQERFILRVKLDSLPLDWKLKVPFTCKLVINLNSNDLSSKSVDEKHENDKCSESTENKMKNFKFINDFTFWDALEIIKDEQNKMQTYLKSNNLTGSPNICFDPLEIDTSYIKRESLNLDFESFASDSKNDSYVEIALYLPYVPSYILPWEFQWVSPLEIYDQSEQKEDYYNNGSLNSLLLNEYNIVPTSFSNAFKFMRLWIETRNDLIMNERDLYEHYKRLWHVYIRKLKKKENDLFSWGVLPVRAMDLPDMFTPLPAGYNKNDISYPYINQGTTSPFDVKGYGIGDINFKLRKYSQLENIKESNPPEYNIIGTSRQRDSQTSRRKQEETVVTKQPDGEYSTRSNVYLVPFFSNLTGPSVRWTYSIMDSLKEPIESIQDFNSLPIYKAMKCPEMSFYKLENLIAYDRRNLVSNEQLHEDELNYRVSQVWSKFEVRTFTEKYLMYPKNFSKIAQFLENKKVSDCVEFYYRFKYRLKLKNKLQELKSRIKGKFDMTRNLRREACILDSLESVLDDCDTNMVTEFNQRNKLSFNGLSDYLLRSGCIDSDNHYDVQYTQHYDPVEQSDEEHQYTLDNIGEGYFFPRKYLALTTRKTVHYPTIDSNDNNKSDNSKGCFVFEYRPRPGKEVIDDENEQSDISSDSERALIVTVNSEAFFNNRFKGYKKVALSNIDKILFEYDDANNLMTGTFSPQENFENTDVTDESMLDLEGVKVESDVKLDTETPTNKPPPAYEGMVTRKKVLSHTRYGYESPRPIRHTTKSKTKKKTGKWTVEEKEKYRETFSIYGKDWSKLYQAMSPYGKSMDQVKNYYHKNNFKRRLDRY